MALPTKAYVQYLSPRDHILRALGFKEQKINVSTPSADPLPRKGHIPQMGHTALPLAIIGS